MTVDFNGKMDAIYTDLNGKFEALNTHVKKLDTQVAQTAESVKRQDGFLRGKTDMNPRQHVNSITLRSGKKVNLVLGRGLNRDELVVIEELKNSDDFETPEAVSFDTSRVSIDTIGQESIRDGPESNMQEISVDQTRVLFDTPMVSFDTNPKNVPELTRNIAVLTKGKRVSIDIVPAPKNQPESTAERVYKPKVPYPKPPKKSRREIEDARCKAMTDMLVVELPFVDVVKTSPAFRRYVKRMVASNVSLEGSTDDY